MARAPKAGSKRKRWTRRIVIGGVVFVAANIGLVEMTSQSWFCNSCHIMNPFYDSWKTSSHSDVHCVECHIPPGVDSFVAAKLNGLGQVVDDVLNRTSTKPSAAVSSLSCMRSGCHTVERIVANEAKIDRFRFSHEKHYDKEAFGIKMDCTTCHSHVKGDEHFEVNTNVCFVCHLSERDPGSPAGAVLAALVEPGAAGGTAEEAGEGSPVPGMIRMSVRRGAASGTDPHSGLPPPDCRSCHEPPKEELEYQGLKVNHEEFLAYNASCESCHHNATSMPSTITDAACLSCHTFGAERATSAEELHRVHAEGKHKIECFSCHGMAEHGPDAQMHAIDDFDCRKCHIDQHEVQRQTYLRMEEPDPAEAEASNPMFMAHVDCTGCHVSTDVMAGMEHNGARVVRASAQGCDSCHQPGLGEQMIPLWQNATRALYEQAERNLSTIDGAGLNAETRPLYDEASSLIELVRMDGSWGVHNPRYTQKLLERAREKIAAIRKAAEPAEGGS